MVNQYSTIIKTLKEQLLKDLAEIKALIKKDAECGINSIIDLLVSFPLVQELSETECLSAFVVSIVELYNAGENIDTMELIKQIERFMICIEQEYKVIVLISDTVDLRVRESLDYEIISHNMGVTGVYIYNNTTDNIEVTAMEDNKFFAVFNIDNVIDELINSSFQSQNRQILTYHSALSKLNNNLDAEWVVMGSSYSLYGVNEDYIDKNILNLSILGIDLYHLDKVVDRFIMSKSKIKDCIISVSYNMLHYDISKSLNKKNKNTYNNIFAPLLHEHTVDNNRNKSCNSFITMSCLDTSLKAILNEDKLRDYVMDCIINNKYSDNHHIYFTEEYTREKRIMHEAGYEYTSLTKEEKEVKLKKTADAHSKLLKYTDTFIESTEIFSNILKKLNDIGIEPILTVLPMQSHYANHLDKRLKDTFYAYMTSIQNQVAFKLVDYMNHKEFDNSDFVDTYHLSTQGSIKASQIIYNYIMNSN